MGWEGGKGDGGGEGNILSLKTIVKKKGFV